MAGYSTVFVALAALLVASSCPAAHGSQDSSYPECNLCVRALATASLTMDSAFSAPPTHAPIPQVNPADFTDTGVRIVRNSGPSSESAGDHASSAGRSARHGARRGRNIVDIVKGMGRRAGAEGTHGVLDDVFSTPLPADTTKLAAMLQGTCRGPRAARCARLVADGGFVRAISDASAEGLTGRAACAVAGRCPRPSGMRFPRRLAVDAHGNVASADAAETKAAAEGGATGAVAASGAYSPAMAVKGEEKNKEEKNKASLEGRHEVVRRKRAAHRERAKQAESVRVARQDVPRKEAAASAAPRRRAVRTARMWFVDAAFDESTCGARPDGASAADGVFASCGSCAFSKVAGGCLCPRSCYGAAGYLRTWRVVSVPRSRAATCEAAGCREASAGGPAAAAEASRDGDAASADTLACLCPPSAVGVTGAPKDTAAWLRDPSGPRSRDLSHMMPRAKCWCDLCVVAPVGGSHSGTSCLCPQECYAAHKDDLRRRRAVVRERREALKQRRGAAAPADAAEVTAAAASKTPTRGPASNSAPGPAASEKKRNRSVPRKSAALKRAAARARTRNSKSKK